MKTKMQTNQPTEIMKTKKTGKQHIEIKVPVCSGGGVSVEVASARFEARRYIYIAPGMAGKISEMEKDEEFLGPAYAVSSEGWEKIPCEITPLSLVQSENEGVCRWYSVTAEIPEDYQPAKICCRMTGRIYIAQIYEGSAA